MVLGALATLLDMESDIEVVASCPDGRSALQQIKDDPPDVVVTDIEMPQMSGLDLALAIQQMTSPPKVIIVTTFARPGYLRRAMNAGVSGYLLKDSPMQELANAIRTIHRGGKVIAPELAAEAWGEEDPLTERERQVLRHAAEGLSTADIAGKVHLAEGTVRNYLSEVMSKLHAGNRIEAVRIARQKGWL
ncbi:MAG: response regulator transcription factor [Wenzhouxiangellaceae bacterium]